MTLAFTTRLASPDTALARRPSFAEHPFQLGVASGEPRPDAIVLWTRLAPRPLEPLGGLEPRRYRVRWELAEDDAFTQTVRQGEVWADPEYAHSVHIDVGGLRPARHYFYRFESGGDLSPVGRTKTAPAAGARLDRMAFAFASCQAWPDGYYTAYAHMAADDLDVVFHLGDYLYEYGIDAMGGVRHTPVPAEFQSEADSLDRYRLQYGLYKSDPDLRAAHAAFPFVATWDDHEAQNNYAGDQPQEGGDPAAFLVRRAAAYRAYWEHQPLRIPQRPNGPDMVLNRRLGYGNLAEFNVLDTRQHRADQACADGVDDGCAARLEPSRSLLGDAQEQWLYAGLGRSRATWNVLAQQVVVHERDLDAAGPQPLGMDAWDGYAANRERLFSALTELPVANAVVLTGDDHSSSAADLKADFGDESSAVVGVEFVGPSISSGGNSASRPNVPAGGRDPVNPHRRYSAWERGHVRCEVTPGWWRADYWCVPYVDRPGAPLERRATFVTEAGRPGLHLL